MTEPRAFKHSVPPATLMDLHAAKRTSTIMFGKGAMKITWEHVVARFSEEEEDWTADLP